MEQKMLTCIGCPLGCAITATPNQDGGFEIAGYTCKRGLEYAQKELTCPERTVTSTIRVTGGTAPVVSVRTAANVPKDMIRKVIEAINALSVSAPVKMGDVLLENIAGTGVALTATKSVKKGNG